MLRGKNILFCAILLLVLMGTSAAQPPLNYVVALDDGGKVSDKLGVETTGEVYRAHLGRMGAVTFFVARALQQNVVVVSTVPTFRNLLTLAGDLTSPGRIAWWKRYVNVSATAEEDLRSQVQRMQGDELTSADRAYVRDVLLPHVRNDYVVYLAKTEDLIVCVPKKTTLIQAGIRSEAVSPLDFSDFVRAEEDLSKNETVAISVDNLIKLFDTANRVPKNVILNGHGFYDVGLFGKRLEKDSPLVFAGLDPDSYRRFVQLLTQVWCQSFFAFTCFSGDQAISQMHEKTTNRLWKLFFDVRDIRFPIIMGATSANPMTACTRLTPADCKPLDFDVYYREINRFVMQTTNPYAFGAQESLRRACFALQGEYVVENTPSIRMPGKNSAFRAVSTSDAVKVLTVETQKEWTAEHKDAPLIIPARENGMLLYYPAIITVPIKIPLLNEELRIKTSEVTPQMLSMAQGTFLHTFKKLDAPELGFTDLLCTLFGLLAPSVRAFVVDEVVCLDQTLKRDSRDGSENASATPIKQLFHGLVAKTEGRTVKSPAGVDTHIVRFTVVRKNAFTGRYQEGIAPAKFAKNDEGHWYMVATNANVGERHLKGRLAQFVWKDIDAKRYEEVARQVINSSLPDKETIFQASGGKETIAQVKKAAEDIVARTLQRT